ncbi:MAG: hypothetical protein FWC40_04230 [Proteobacteria bacterium]|nr:hypothetical protein [Pseudomonadota bacterium]MCL2325689.1 hypothetical protein [Pseudomonadota bacterium]
MNKRYTFHAFFIHLVMGLALCLALFVPIHAHAQEADPPCAFAAAAPGQCDSWYLDIGARMGYLGFKGGWTEGRWGDGFLMGYTLGVRLDWWGIYANLQIGIASPQREDLRADAVFGEGDPFPFAAGFSIGPRFFLDYGQMKLWGQASFAVGQYGYFTLGPEFTAGFTYYFRQFRVGFGFFIGLDFTYYIGASKYWDHQKAKMVWGATHHIMPQFQLGLHF